MDLNIRKIINDAPSPDSYRINQNIFKYREFVELKVLVWDTKSNITSK